MVPVYRFALWLWLKRCEILGPRPQGCVRKTKPSGVRDRVCSASNNDDVKNQLFSKASFNQCGMCKNCKCEWNFVLLLLSESKKLLAKSLLLAWSVCVHKKNQKLRLRRHPQNACGVRTRVSSVSGKVQGASCEEGILRGSVPGGKRLVGYKLIFCSLLTILNVEE